MLSKNQRSFKNRTIKLIKDLLTGMPKKLKDENVIKFFRYPEKDFVTLYFFSFVISCRKKVYINLLTTVFGSLLSHICLANDFSQFISFKFKP